MPTSSPLSINQCASAIAGINSRIGLKKRLSLYEPRLCQAALKIICIRRLMPMFFLSTYDTGCNCSIKRVDTLLPIPIHPLASLSELPNGTTGRSPALILKALKSVDPDLSIGQKGRVCPISRQWLKRFTTWLVGDIAIGCDDYARAGSP